MQRLWSADELDERWTLLREDLALLAGLPDTSKLGLAAQLAYWRQNGRFPDDEADLAPTVVGHLAAQVGVGADVLDGYDWAGRTGRRHRRLILDHLAVATFDDAAEAGFRRWLGDELLPREPGRPRWRRKSAAWFARESGHRPGAYRLDRILRSACAAHDDAALQRVAGVWTPGRAGGSMGCSPTTVRARRSPALPPTPAGSGWRACWPRSASSKRLRALALPPDLLRGLHPDQAKRFRRRAAVESAWELRRHPERIRLPLLAFWCAPREAEVVDGLVELLIQVTHRITVKAERRVVEELVEEALEVRGKAGILFSVAEAAVGRPEGVVREVIFPVVGEQTFEALVREARALGTPQSGASTPRCAPRTAPITAG